MNPVLNMCSITREILVDICTKFDLLLSWGIESSMAYCGFRLNFLS